MFFFKEDVNRWLLQGVSPGLTRSFYNYGVCGYYLLSESNVQKTGSFITVIISILLQAAAYQAPYLRRWILKVFFKFWDPSGAIETFWLTAVASIAPSIWGKRLHRAGNEPYFSLTLKLSSWAEKTEQTAERTASVVCLWCSWRCRLFNPGVDWAVEPPPRCLSPPLIRFPLRLSYMSIIPSLITPLSLSHYLSLPPPHALAQCLLLPSQCPRSFSADDWTDSEAAVCVCVCAWNRSSGKSRVIRWRGRGSRE